MEDTTYIRIPVTLLIKGYIEVIADTYKDALEEVVESWRADDVWAVLKESEETEPEEFELIAD